MRREPSRQGCAVAHGIDIGHTGGKVGTNEHSAIGCQLRPGTGQQAGVGGNADGYHAKVTGVGAAVGLYLLHEGTAWEGAHLLTQIELHALRFQLLLDQLAHLRVKLGQKLLLFFNDTHIAAQLEEGLCDLQTGPAAAQDHDVPHIGVRTNSLRKIRSSTVLRVCTPTRSLPGTCGTRLEEPVASTSLS